MGGTLDYTIGSVGHEQTLQVAHANNDVVQVKLKTLAIERANTIAIFDASSNGFTGHYQEKERTTVFQLYLNTDTIFEGTPFVEGPNAIVIPTSLFTKTELHGYIEHDRLDETPLYSDEEGKYEFYSVDRDGNKLEDACGDCDFHIVRFDISAEEAMEILDLLLNCLIEEETNETAVLYSYISTKDDGISATMMNLPSAAMLFIPLDSPYVSAELGATPRPFDPLAWWLGLLIVILCIITFGIAYLIITIVSSIADITNQNNQNAQSIGMTILSWLAHLAWLLVRAAILVFAYVLLAIKILNILLEYVMYLAMIPFILMFGGEANYNVMSFEYSLKGLPIKTETTVTTNYVDYFDIDLPLVIRDESMDNTLVSRKEETLGIGLTKDNDYGYPDISQSSKVYTSSDGKSTLSNINVSPNGGDTQTLFRFEITYTDVDNRAPQMGFPELHVSNDEWLYEKVYTMNEVNNTDDVYTDGKEYFLELSFDKIGVYYFYFEVNTSTDIIVTEQYQLYVEDLSVDEKLTRFFNGIGDSILLATIIITALGAVPILVDPNLEAIAALLTYALFIGVATTIFTLCLNSEDPLSPYYSAGWVVGLWTAVLLFAFFCKIGHDFKPSESSYVMFLKIIVILIGSGVKLIIGSINTLFEGSTFDRMMREFAEMLFQGIALIFACWFAAETIFDSLSAGTEDITQIITLCTMIWFMGFGFLFLLQAFV